MNRNRLCAFFFYSLMGALVQLNAQEKVWTVGGQFKPIFSSSLFGTGAQNLPDSSYIFTLRPKGGYAAGMVIRRGYTRTLSIEFGINFTARNYQVSASGGATDAATSFRIVGYEIPLSQLVFIRLSEKIYMNASGGICINMFPSDVISEKAPMLVYAGREMIFHPGLLANVGFEYRSKKSGYFYIGSSLNRPFQQIYTMAAQYQINGAATGSVLSGFSGSYLTVDLRYFFHEDSEKKIKRKQTGK
jgi:hypothetical protein